MKKVVAIILASAFVLGLGFAPVQNQIAEKPPIGGSPVLDAVAYDVVIMMEKPPIGG